DCAACEREIRAPKTFLMRCAAGCGAPRRCLSHRAAGYFAARKGVSLMTTLLLPGRHVLNTRFQEIELFRLLAMPLADLPVLGERPAGAGAMIDRLVFAVTSANQSNSRYNPVPLEVRTIGVDRFARRLKESLGTSFRIVPVPHFGPTGRFADFILKE